MIKRIYSRIVIDIASGDVIEAIAFDYDGNVASCKGAKAAKPVESAGSKIIAGLSGPISRAIEGDITNNPFTNPSSDIYKQTLANLRGGYGARGLEGSGIAVQGEQDALQKIVNQSQAQRAGQLTALVGAGSGSPVFAPQQQPSGFMGTK